MEVGKDNYRKHRKPRKRSNARKNAMAVTNEYASESTIHGLSYITNRDQPVGGRCFWAVVVILAILAATFQVVSLCEQWKNKPVVTNLESISLPIEEIEFPAVTICPQGNVKHVMDNVMFIQLKDYIRNKTRRGEMIPTAQVPREERSASQYHEISPANMTYAEMTIIIKEFLRDRYPGAKDNPKKVVTLLTSDDPQKSAQNDAILQLNEEKECNETSNYDIMSNLNKALNGDFCPNGFTKVNEICVRKIGTKMVYHVASEHCSNFGGATILQVRSYDDIYALNLHRIIGIT